MRCPFQEKMPPASAWSMLIDKKKTLCIISKINKTAWNEDEEEEEDVDVDDVTVTSFVKSTGTRLRLCVYLPSLAKSREPSLINFKLRLLNLSREYCLDAFLQSVPAFIIAANSS